MDAGAWFEVEPWISANNFTTPFILIPRWMLIFKQSNSNCSIAISNASLIVFFFFFCDVDEIRGYVRTRTIFARLCNFSHVVRLGAFIWSTMERML